MTNIRKIGIKFSVPDEVMNRFGNSLNQNKKRIGQMKTIASVEKTNICDVVKFEYNGGSEPNTIRNAVITNMTATVVTAWDFKRRDYRTFSRRHMKNVAILEGPEDGLTYSGNPDNVDNRTLLKAMTDASGQYSVYNNEDMDLVFIFDNTVKLVTESSLTITGSKGSLSLKIYIQDDGSYANDNVRIAGTWGDYVCKLPADLMLDLRRLC